MTWYEGFCSRCGWAEHFVSYEACKVASKRHRCNPVIWKPLGPWQLDVDGWWTRPMRDGTRRCGPKVNKRSQTKRKAYARK